jgi:hypothetical protein
MNLATRFLLLFWGAVLAAGCSSSMSPRGGERDTGVPDPAPAPDSGRDRVVPWTSGATDGPRTEPLDVAAADVGCDTAGDVDAEPDAAPVPAHACSAGHACTGVSRCQRACYGPFVYRCACADGRFVCTGCLSIDAGAGDARSGPPGCAADVTDGHRCDVPGAVCQQTQGGAQRLCACGDFVSRRAWICQ